MVWMDLNSSTNRIAFTLIEENIWFISYYVYRYNVFKEEWQRRQRRTEWWLMTYWTYYCRLRSQLFMIISLPLHSSPTKLCISMKNTILIIHGRRERRTGTVTVTHWNYCRKFRWFFRIGHCWFVTRSHRWEICNWLSTGTQWRLWRW